MKFLSQFFKSNSEDQDPGIYKLEGRNLIKMDSTAKGMSINQAIEELGYNTAEIHTIISDYFDCIGVKVFTKEPVLVSTNDKKAVNYKILEAELRKVDWEEEYESHIIEDILVEGITSKYLTFNYLDSVLKLEQESKALFLARDIEMYLSFNEGILINYVSSDWTNADSGWLKKLNPKMFDNILYEAAEFHDSEIEAMEEVNLQCAALQEIPEVLQNEFIPLHTKKNSNIHFFNLLAAHYNLFQEQKIKIDDFLVVNKGRVNTIKDGMYEVSEVIYHFNENGILQNTNPK